MKTAAVSDLKARLSRYLSLVKAGEEILITERSVPVARLVPVGHRPRELESLRDLERQGLIRLGSGSFPKEFWKLLRGRDSRATIRRAVEEERGEGW